MSESSEFSGLSAVPPPPANKVIEEDNSPVPAGSGDILEAALRHRKGLFNLTTVDEERLRGAAPWIERNIDGLVDEFYQTQMAVPEVARMITDAAMVVRLKKTMRAYIITLFAGPHDLAYRENRLHIGRVHQQEGVRPDLYLSASKTLRDLILKTLHPYLADHPEAAGTLEALEKIFYFDLSLVFDTYIQTLVTEVEKERRRAATYAAEMEKVSCTDGLTGLGNQRLLMATLRHDLEIARRRRAPLSLVYFDVDRFKQINDTQGHQRGDAILQTVGECLRSILRASDTACRYGGDEFAVILNDCTRHQAATFCSRLIEAFSSRVPGVTFSIGIEEAGPGTLLTSQELIARADRKMYLAKDKTGFRFEI